MLTEDTNNAKDARGNCLSRFLFIWIEIIIFRGFRRKITFQDIPNLPPDLQVRKLKDNFTKIWYTQKKPSLSRTILRLNISDLIQSGIYLVISNLADMSCLVMGWLVLEIVLSQERNAEKAQQGILYCSLFTLVSIVYAIMYPKYIYINLLLDIKTFTQCIIALFQKSFSLPQDVINQVSVGRILNLITNDIRSLEYKHFRLGYLLGFPLTFVGACLFLYFIIGKIALVGLGAIWINIFIVLVAIPLMASMRSKNLISTDKRVKFMNQVLKNMRVVKMFALENLVQSLVKKIRRKEWQYGMSYALVRTGTSVVLFTFGNSFTIYSTFLVSYFTDSPIGFGKAVLCFMFYIQLQNYAGQFLQSIAALVEISISADRISKYLYIKTSQNLPSQTTIGCSKCIHIHNLTVEWPNHSKGLDNIQLTVTNVPQLIFVTGAVGAGKSTLLLTLCNEISNYEGSVQVNGKVAYAAQESWIFSGTIRDNILVGRELDHDRYWAVIAACGLLPDMETFAERDHTLVGERGITLSGGQKARVALARTVYTIADIYLLDDPLGAVDTRVSKHIFEECIQGLLKDKVIILATHQTRFVRDQDIMILLDNGRIVEDSKYAKTRRCKLEGFSELNNSDKIKTEKARPGGGIIDLDCVTDREREIQDSKPLSTALSEEISNRTGFSVYLKYFKNGGFCLTFMLILFTVITNMSQLAFVWWTQKVIWLASITKSYDNNNFTNLSNQTRSIAPSWFFHIIGNEHLITISALIVGTLFFLAQEWLTLLVVTWRAAISLHSKMLKSVMSTAIRFFEVNPSGRVLNRFSKDVGYVDYNISITMLEYWIVLFAMIFPLIAGCIVQKLLILPAIILIIVFFAAVRYYLPTAAEIRNIESIMRSPLYSHVSLALQGMTTIRALGMRQKVEEDLIYHLNSHTKVWVTLQTGSAWFIQRLAFIFRAFLSIAVWAAFMNSYYYKSSENIALSFQILLTIPSMFLYISVLAVNLDILMVAVDRILNYIKLKPEIDNEDGNVMSSKIKKHKPNPQERGVLYEGNVTFENVHFRYADDLPMVLRGVSLKILGGSKVGIVGRTGAGKSSIINALFRLTNLSAGRILIDGMDIRHFKLSHLRSQMSVIPQDPMLFTGTLRFNLDPTDQFSDSEIWSSLEHVQLRQHILSLQGGIYTTVEEDGNNFSVGEKQLLCLARALLRHTRILVVDEATANVDHLTDAKIQNTLRTSFSNQTIISIAHRLNTVIDYDSIVVLEQGDVVEMDHPHLLLENDQSYLSKLVSQTDPVTQSRLRESAYAAYCSDN